MNGIHITTDESLDPNTPPGGFKVPEYLMTVKELFEEKFMPDGTKVLIKEIVFAESRDFEHIDLELPAIVLDLQGAKINPSSGEFEHKKEGFESNIGELALYAYMRACIVVNTRNHDPHVLVRQLAFDIAGYVNESERFQQPVGISQVTTIGPIEATRRDNTTIIAWEIIWQHTIEIGEPNYDSIFGRDDADAVPVSEILIGLKQTDKFSPFPCPEDEEDKEKPMLPKPPLDEDGEPIELDENGKPIKPDESGKPTEGFPYTSDQGIETFEIYKRPKTVETDETDDSEEG